MEGWAGFRPAVKLKNLKEKIKEWAKSHFGQVGLIKDSILEEIRLLDLKQENCQLSEEERAKRFQLKKMFELKVRGRNYAKA